MPTYNITVDDNSPLLRYSEGWDAIDSKSSQFLNDTGHTTQTIGANVTWTFNGTAFWIGGTLGPDHGLFSVILDGQSESVNASASKKAVKQILFSRADLNNTEHTVTLSNAATKQSQSAFGLDFVIFTTGDGNENTVLLDSAVDDTDPSLTYSSGWTTPSNKFTSMYHNATFHDTNHVGATVDIPFDGSAIAIYGATAPNHGPFSVYLDGVGPMDADGNAPTFEAQTLLYYASNLPNTSHVLQLVNTNTNTSAFVDFDFAVVSKYALASGSGAEPSPLGQPPAGAAQPVSHNSQAGLIAGVTIGAAFFVIVLAILLWRILRRKRATLARDTESKLVGPPATSMPSLEPQWTVDPFAEPNTDLDDNPYLRQPAKSGTRGRVAAQRSSPTDTVPAFSLGSFSGHLPSERGTDSVSISTGNRSSLPLPWDLPRQDSEAFQISESSRTRTAGHLDVELPVEPMYRTPPPGYAQSDNSSPPFTKAT